MFDFVSFGPILIIRTEGVGAISSGVRCVCRVRASFCRLFIHVTNAGSAPRPPPESLYRLHCSLIHETIATLHRIYRHPDRRQLWRNVLLKREHSRMKHFLKTYACSLSMKYELATEPPRGATVASRLGLCIFLLSSILLATKGTRLIGPNDGG